MSSPHNKHILIERFEKIYFSTKDQLIVFVKKNAPDKNMVDDIVQECYIALWDKLKGFVDEDRDRLMALLCTIAKRKIINALQKSSREHLRAEVFYQSLPHTPSTEEGLHLKKMVHDYKKAVDAMPPKRREAYRLVKEEGLSHQQTAERMNISPHTIERHINEAMKTLRQQFTVDKVMLIMVMVKIGICSDN